jgi:thiamine monophosphate synthase
VIPRLLAISPPGGPALAAWLSSAPERVAAGADALLLRVFGGPVRSEDYADLAATGAVVIVHQRTVGVQGIHVHLASSEDPVAWRPRVPGLLGVSCHGPADLLRAAAAGCDYATLSPIFSPGSKPDDTRDPLGPSALREAPLPVLALGGIGPGNVSACLEAGAHGVAGIGAFSAIEAVAAMVAERDRCSR